MLDSLRPQEKFPILTSFFHLIIFPLTLFSYSFVAFYGLMEVVFKGKQVCKHGASKKSELV
jgi:hypothetical protein